MWSPSLHIYGWPQPTSFLAHSAFQQTAITAGWGYRSCPLSQAGKNFVYSWSWYLKVGYLFGRRLPKDVLYLDPDTPVLCTAWAAEKPSLRREEGRMWHIRCFGVTCMPCNKHQRDPRWTFCNRRNKAAERLDRPSRGWHPLKTPGRASSALPSQHLLRSEQCWSANRHGISQHSLHHLQSLSGLPTELPTN